MRLRRNDAVSLAGSRVSAAGGAGRRWKRAFVAALLLSVLGGTVALGMNEVVQASAAEYIVAPEEAPAADSILVLGARVYNDQSVSPMLRDRLEGGLALYRAGKAPKIIVSGDHGTVEYDEVNAMKNYLVDRGVPPEDIFMDHAGFSTYESVYRARDIFKAEKLLVVTQRYHLSRAVYAARGLGVDAYGVASDPRTYVGAEVREAREKLARVKDFLLVHVTRPEPTYLGEPFPVTGDGRLTHD
ncbi:YdcF family protein [Paenibacillus sp. TRM 82003]|nr:YdcF family protein [Paenibacillus sp. TRM 82003]